MARVKRNDIWLRSRLEGKKVDEFGDYFRIIRWNQGPGCDQPHGESDLIKNKVASSISHMYKRPRVWLEGFYASNWGQTPQHLSNAIFSNFAMGQNLLSLHGLYYSTMGGWWEWAPPCNHFRQPYWKEMPTLLKCVQRLSFLLSQGTHRADIAIMYPLEPKVAGFGTMSVDLAFGLADRLYNSGRDFDFMDAESIERAEYGDGKIKVSGEEFEVLIIPAMEAMRQSTLESLASLARAGARIWFLGPTPKVSDWLENFPGGNQISELERSSVEDIVKGMLKLESVRVFNNSDELIESMAKSFQADFKILSGKIANPRVLHRNINGDDYYCLYNIPAGSVCEFRAEGKVTLLDPFSGKERDINVICQQNGVSTISTPLNSTDFQILRFNRHKKATFAKSTLNSEKLLSSQELSGKWNFYFKPVLDNSWGDFEWPPSNELIGPQIRFVRSRQNLDAGNKKFELEQIGFSSKFLILGPFEKPILTSNADDILERFAENSAELKISMRFGVLGDSAHQGYHGLKAEISDDFIRLGKIVVGDTSMIRTAENAGNYYYLYTRVYAPRDGYFKILTGDMRPGEIFLNGELIDSLSSSALLRRGANELILRYDSHGATHFLFCDTDAPDTQFEFAIKQAPLSMSWNGKKNILPFDAITDFSSPIILSFESAPALKEFQFTIMGDEVKVLVNGKAAELHLLSVGDDSAKTYKARVGNVSKGTSNVEISVNKPMPGFGAAAALRGYIRQTCAVGEIELSSWDKFEGMRTYSGGAVYSKQFELSRDWVGKRIELDIGKVGGLARVRLNGKDASVRFYPLGYLT